MKHQSLLSTGEVARLLGIRLHQINYAHTNGFVAEPQLRVAGKRVYGAEDVRRLAEHFKATKKKRRYGEKGRRDV